MGDGVDALLRRMSELPELLVYVVVGLFAAVENIFPPVPADVVALFGGFLAGNGAASPWIVFLVVWLANVAGALLVYWIGRRYGERFFSTRVGRLILQPHQLQKLDAFYRRRGTIVIFVSRFLPMFRAVVPAFAGMSGISLGKAAVPVLVASGLWYGLVVYVGATAGENWEAIRAGLESLGRWIYLVALVLLAGVVWAWWRSRDRSGAGT